MNNKVKVGLLVLVFAVCARFFGIDKALVEELTDKVEETEKIGHLTNYLPTTNLGDTISYGDFFTVSYSNNHRQAEWVAYELSKENLAKDEFPRSPSFKTDDRVEKEFQARSEDYTSTGFDRGHLAAAADFSWSKDGIEMTFFTTNVSPQEPDFNRGIWKQLESHVRGWAIQYEQLYVVTGPILTERAKKRFPKEKNYIAVPQRFYKVLLNYTDDNPIAIGFIMKNEDSKEHLSTFVVSIDEIEKITGIDFFPELPNDIEKSVEAQKNLSDWGLDAMSRSASLEYDESEAQ
ncbi:MAG: DNA/RNA non-specific endonuclease [Saprospiraceae bacterium]|nr:DNA/RNA non-specific endonuclease [Saprospiraceae bacterium]